MKELTYSFKESVKKHHVAISDPMGNHVATIYADQAAVIMTMYANMLRHCEVRLANALMDGYILGIAHAMISEACSGVTIDSEKIDGADTKQYILKNVVMVQVDEIRSLETSHLQNEASWNASDLAASVGALEQIGEFAEQGDEYKKYCGADTLELEKKELYLNKVFPKSFDIPYRKCDTCKIDHRVPCEFFDDHPGVSKEGFVFCGLCGDMVLGDGVALNSMKHPGGDE